MQTRHDPSRRRFVGYLGKGAAVIALVGPIEGCSADTALEEVLALLPTVGEIIDVIGTGIATLDPGIGSAIGAALQIIGTSFTQIQTIIDTYKTDVAGIPPTLLNELDAAISAIMTQITAIEGEIPGLPTIVALGINVGLSAFQAILGYLGAIIPAPVASLSFPRSYAMALNRGVKFGGMPGAMSVIPSERAFATNFNTRMDNAGWKNAHIHVDWLRFRGVPILP